MLLAICGLIYMDTAIGVTIISFVLPAAQCDLQMDSTSKGWLTASPMLGKLIYIFCWMIFFCKWNTNTTQKINMYRLNKKSASHWEAIRINILQASLASCNTFAWFNTSQVIYFICNLYIFTFTILFYDFSCSFFFFWWKIINQFIEFFF